MMGWTMAELDISRAIQYGMFAQYMAEQFQPNINGTTYSRWGSFYNPSQYIFDSNWIKTNSFGGQPPEAAQNITNQMARDAELLYNSPKVDAAYATGLARPWQTIDASNGKIHSGITISKPSLSGIVNVLQSLNQPKVSLNDGTIYQPLRVDDIGDGAKPASVTFSLTPGSSTSISISNKRGATISSTVVEGLSTTNSQELGLSTSVTVGVEASVGIPLIADATVKTEIQNTINSTWGSSRTVDFSKSNEKVSSSETDATFSQTLSLGANEQQLQWTNPYTGKIVTIKAGQNLRMVMEVTEGKAVTPITSTWDITSNSPIVLSDSLNNKVTQTAAEALKDALAWNFGGGSGQSLNPKNIKFEGTKAIYTGNVSYETNYGVNAKVVLYVQETGGSWVPVQNVAAADAPAAASTLPVIFDLPTMAKGIAPNSGIKGVWFENTADEKLMPSTSATVIGAPYSTANVGDLNYTFKGFSDAQINAGNGDNFVLIAAQEANNTVRLGNGNNTISIAGDQNTAIMGKGLNVLIINGKGINAIDLGESPDAVKINSLEALTYVNNFDFREDTISFGKGIDPAKISFYFDDAHGRYTVLGPNGKVLAYLFPDAANIPRFDMMTNHFEGEVIFALPYDKVDNRAFVLDSYGQMLDRAPSQKDLGAWSSGLDSKNISRKDFVFSVLNSAEFNAGRTDAASLVNDVYLDVFGRLPEASGFLGWVEALNGGMTREAFYSGVVNSEEFKALIGLAQVQPGA